MSHNTQANKLRGQLRKLASSVKMPMPQHKHKFDALIADYKGIVRVYPAKKYRTKQYVR